MLFSPAMREATKAVGVDISRGYYMIHGSSDDAQTNGFDDDRQNDVLYILVHTAQAQQYAHIYSAGMNFCALWDVFWHKQMERLPLGDRTPQVWQLASTHIKLKVSTGSDANRSFLDWAKKEKLFLLLGLSQRRVFTLSIAPGLDTCAIRDRAGAINLEK